MVTKLGRMITYLYGITLITWSSKTTWQTKIITSSLPQFLWPPNLAGWQPIFMGPCAQSNMTCWSHGLIRSRSRDNLKLFYLHYHSAYGIATKLGKLVTCHKGLPPMLLYSLVTLSCDKLKTYLMPTEYGSVMTYFGWLLPLKSHDHIIR